MMLQESEEEKRQKEKRERERLRKQKNREKNPEKPKCVICKEVRTPLHLCSALDESSQSQ
jgi:hypothetical protein